jgi:hypothetical protein
MGLSCASKENMLLFPVKVSKGVGEFKVFILWESSWTYALPLGIFAIEAGRQQRVQEFWLGGGGWTVV